MTEKVTFKISVKDLIEINHKKGDLSRGYVSRTRALDGIREHTRIQSLRPAHYKKEVPVSLMIERSAFDLKIFGRIDGIFESEDLMVVEEIKTCQNSPERFANEPAWLHLAQLKCYGYMILKEKKLKKIDLLLTYVQVNSKKTAENKKTYSADELKDFFEHLINRYTAILQNMANWNRVRNNSIENLPFPYENFREGQRDLAEAVYKIIKNEKILFARAPTGTGKTIATLFPAIKSIGLKQVDKIFYLTAKTIGRTVAVKALNDMRKNGLRLKSVVLTAKQKICLVSDDSCDMETCPYAQDYYGKLYAAMAEVHKYDAFDQDLIETLGQKYQICPFELSLDISKICDVIICDLNYCFDPRVYLKRFFDQNNTKFTFLIDEAHNLPDRLRSMYSAQILKTDVLKTQRIIRKKIPALSKSLTLLNRSMLGMKKDCIAQESVFLEFNQIQEAFLSQIRDFAVKADVWLDRNPESEIRSDLLEFYFTASIFITISTFFDANYKFFIERIGENDLCVRLFCMDPSPVFSTLMKRSRSCILFSATLSPVEYYQDILFNDTINPFSIVLPSPFPAANLGLFLYSAIKTTYRERDRYYGAVAGLVRDIVNSKKGNYIIYFPSYAYMNTIVEIMKIKDIPVPDIIVQKRHMTESDKQAFLDSFTHESSVTGFAVMGGIFGEGIDLDGKKLIGAVIVSVGIPQIGPERDLIKGYYDALDNSGFFKSYQMPGFNRVMQAAGRVIRTQTDKGVVILVDARFTRPEYTSLFPLEWQRFSIIRSAQNLRTGLREFWDQKH